jgi:hypothetical protein
MQPCVGWLLHLHRTRRKDSSSRSVSAIRGRSCSSPFTKTGIGLHRPPQVTTSIAPSGRTCAGRKAFLEPDHGHSHCSSRHRRSCRCGDHSCFRAHLQDAAQLAVRALSSRNQQSPDAIMNGAVLDPDKVCPTCQSSASSCRQGAGHRRLSCAAAVRQGWDRGAHSAGVSGACCSSGQLQGPVGPPRSR